MRCQLPIDVGERLLVLAEIGLRLAGFGRFLLPRFHGHHGRFESGERFVELGEAVVTGKRVAVGLHGRTYRSKKKPGHPWKDVRANG
jgi:hypothetical protein